MPSGDRPGSLWRNGVGQWVPGPTPPVAFAEVVLTWELPVVTSPAANPRDVRRVPLTKRDVRFLATLRISAR